MKKLLLCATLLATHWAQAQIFIEDWQGNGPGIDAWTIIDQDNNNPSTNVASYMTDAWVVLDLGGSPFLGGPAGQFAAVSTSDYLPSGTSNDWLITPQITLPQGDINLFWRAKAHDPDYRDGYELKLSPNGGESIEDFTVSLFSINEESSTWVNRSVSLSPYVGTTIRLAWVNQSTDKFLLFINDIVIENSDDVSPDCATLISPANEAENYDPQGAQFSWTEVALAENYDFYVGTSPDQLNLIDNVTQTTIPLYGLQYGTTYYWSVVPQGALASASNCDVFSFTTMESPFAPYCAPLVYYLETEPITLVEFAGIENQTTHLGSETFGHMDYTDIAGNVVPGENYTITLQGYTGGNYANRFIIFIDWNQNDVLDDAGEIYQVTQELVNSSGTDGLEVTHTISVPANALQGQTRMRVKKQFGPNYFTDPCMAPGYGQAHDYTLNVGSLSTVEVQERKVVISPNPTRDVLFISGQPILSAKVYNMLGQEMRIEHQSHSVDVRHLAPGSYVLQIEQKAGEFRSTKFIKK